jgi:bifunctional non-homologous end joining protein LigD
MQLRPMLVTTGPLPPDGERYAYEVKWDGFRALVAVTRDRVEVVSRNGNDMTSRYPELAGLAGRVKDPTVLDGEIVCLDGDGRPDFAALWGRSRGATSPSVCFMVFDVLQLGRKPLVDLPYRERRRILEGLDLAGGHWCTPPSHPGEGAALFAATRGMGLEGVVAKRVDSRYRPGLRTRLWTKAKHFQTRTFALLGWLPPQEWRGDRGCVALGLQVAEGLAFAGVVESGYGRELVDRLPQLKRADLRTLAEPGRCWDGTEPPAAVIKYLEWVPGMGLRHASILSVSS